MGKGEPSGDDLVAAFARWAAEERVNEAARQRSRERWLRQQAVEDATLAGILTDLAERRMAVVATTRGSKVAGRLVGVANDFFVVEDRDRSGVLVVTEHVASISRLTPTKWADPSGDRPPPLSMRLVDALVMLAADRSPIRLGLTNGETVQGDLVAVGRDVITLRGHPQPGDRGRARLRDLYVALGAIEVCAPR